VTYNLRAVHSLARPSYLAVGWHSGNALDCHWGVLVSNPGRISGILTEVLLWFSSVNSDKCLDRNLTWLDQKLFLPGAFQFIINLLSYRLMLYSLSADRRVKQSTERNDIHVAIIACRCLKMRDERTGVYAPKWLRINSKYSLTHLLKGSLFDILNIVYYRTLSWNTKRCYGTLSVIMEHWCLLWYTKHYGTLLWNTKRYCRTLNVVMEYWALLRNIELFYGSLNVSMEHWCLLWYTKHCVLPNVIVKH
jgi:hypothetical protein